MSVKKRRRNREKKMLLRYRKSKRGESERGRKRKID